MSQFVQLIEYRTRYPDEVDELLTNWVANTEGKRTATRTRVGQDQNDSAHFVEILEFPSSAEASRNSRLAETSATHEKFVRLCEEPPRFVDLTMVRDERL